MTSLDEKRLSQELADLRGPPPAPDLFDQRLLAELEAVSAGAERRKVVVLPRFGRAATFLAVAALLVSGAATATMGWPRISGWLSSALPSQERAPVLETIEERPERTEVQRPARLERPQTTDARPEAERPEAERPDIMRPGAERPGLHRFERSDRSGLSQDRPSAVERPESALGSSSVERPEISNEGAASRMAPSLERPTTRESAAASPTRPDLVVERPAGGVKPGAVPRPERPETNGRPTRNGAAPAEGMRPSAGDRPATGGAAPPPPPPPGAPPPR